MIERYLLFVGDSYYADGGWIDFEGSHPTMEDALAAVSPPERGDWWHIVDIASGKIVMGESGSYCGQIDSSEINGGRCEHSKV